MAEKYEARDRGDKQFAVNAPVASAPSAVTLIQSVATLPQYQTPVSRGNLRMIRVRTEAGFVSYEDLGNLP